MPALSLAGGRARGQGPAPMPGAAAALSIGGFSHSPHSINKKEHAQRALFYGVVCLQIKDGGLNNGEALAGPHAFLHRQKQNPQPLARAGGVAL